MREKDVTSEPLVGAQSRCDHQRVSVFEDEAEYEEIDQREIEGDYLDLCVPRLLGASLTFDELCGEYDDAPAACEDCNSPFAESQFVYWETSLVVNSRVRCESCAERVTESLWTEAKAFAVENVWVSEDFPSPEEIAEWQARSDWSPSFDRHLRNALRHRCTNYEQLLRGLEKSDERDQIRYSAIRCRVDELVCKFMEPQ